MANQSDVTGLISFHSTKKHRSIINELVQYTLDKWAYCRLAIDNIYYEEGEERLTPLNWDEEYEFESTGRWHFENSIKHFFEGIKDKELLEKLHGIFIRVQYRDIEWGNMHLEEGNILFTVHINPETGEAKTVISERDIDTLEYNAKNLEKFGYADTAMDTFSDHGIQNFKDYLKEYAKDADEEKDPVFYALGENIDRLTVAEWREIFEEMGADSFVSDYLEDSVLYELFNSYDLRDHPKVDALVIA